MSAVLIARHGETRWNVNGRYQGRLESDLSRLGWVQAQALAQAVAAYGVQRIISSPLKRCMETAQAAGDYLSLPVEMDARLIEIAHGSWEGRYRDELAQNDPERYKAWRSSPATVAFENGESVADVLDRWGDFVRGFQSEQNTLLVTHDAVLRIAILERTRRSLANFWQPCVRNGGFAYFDVSAAAGWQLKNECVCAHLGLLEADISTQAL